MSLFEQALEQFAGVNFADVASQAGVTPAQAESAIGALGTASPEPGSRIAAAAAVTGLPVEKIQAILDAIGGEATIGRLTGALAQGGGIDAITSGLFGKD